MTAGGLIIERGLEIESGGRAFVVQQVLNFDAVLAQDVETGRPERLAIADIRPRVTKVAAAVPDLTTFDGAEWDEARRRHEFLQPALVAERRTRALVEQQAALAGVSANTFYRWLRLFDASGKLTSLLPTRSDGGRGKPRVNDEIEAVIQATIADYYLTRQQRSVQRTCDEVIRRCRNAGLKPPHANTIRNRISTIADKTRLETRSHSKVVYDRFTARPGKFEDAAWPLAIMQIDHTRLDIELVDSQHRRVIGRPWITLAFDVFSRMVAGFYISFDPPGALSTGLCIAHAVLPKETWQARHNLTNPWPLWGLPHMIHMDNALEFRGEMLRRACDQYGIDINFRPVKTPHFGGHIERMLGTLVSEIHSLPGSTFSNPTKRGEYNSSERAALTLDDLETQLGDYITGVYHQRFHSGIGTTPLARYDEGVFGTKDRVGSGLPARVFDEERLRLDFMPHVERTIQTAGVVIDGIQYYSDVFRPYINAMTSGAGKRKRVFLFKRDPRDISVIYFYDPDLNQYTAVSYRNTSHPPMSAWELREVQRFLQEQGEANVDERVIFETYERLRAREDAAVNETKKVRRDRERRSRRPARSVQTVGVPIVPDVDDGPVAPFEEIEDL